MVKKLFFLFFFIIFNTIFTADINVAFVHLGSSFPSYLKDALKQARLFNEGADIYLVCDEPGYRNSSDKEILQQNRIIVVYSHTLKPTNRHCKIKKIYNPHPNFREGYWGKTVERFYYLEELMEEYQLPDLFHFESDVLIYYDLSEHIKIFRKHYKGWAAPLRSHDHCSPCFVYIHDVKKLAHYLDFLLQESYTRSKEIGLDMLVPIKYGNKLRKGYLEFLPLVPFEYAKHYHFITEKYEKAANQEWYDNHAEDFNSIFDAANFGFFLGGVDPRNRGPGFDHGPGTIFPNALFDMTKFKIEWIRDHKQRLIPFAEFMGKKYRINNLHVNSKDLHNFASYR